MYKTTSLFQTTFLIFYLLGVFPLQVLSQNLWESPLHQCWEISAENVTQVLNASDNTLENFFSIKNNSIQSNNIQGKYLWEKEVNNEKILHLELDSNKIFLITEPDKNANSDQFIIYAISQATGLTIWKKKLEKKQNTKIFMSQTNKLIFIYTNKIFFLIDKENGIDLNYNNDPFNKKNLSNNKDEIIYVPITNKKIATYSINLQRIIKETELPFPATKINTNNSEKWLISNQTGQFILFNKNKLVWKIQVGAEIIDYIWNNTGISIISNDNYLYQISPAKGKILWKKRFSGRLEIQTDLENNIILAVDLNYGALYIINSINGKLLNQLTLQNNIIFIGKPIIINQQIIIHTTQGIKSFSSSCP